ncbi:MAG: exosortase-associated EpsI family protein [Dechloromonas sp.]|nr:MAG: exosortase-associated EpsI family protein [Dechloromonas sp.]
MPFIFTHAPQRLVIALAAGLLTIAVTLSIYGSSQPSERTLLGAVANLLPASELISDWEIAIMPVAATPEMKKAVAEMLNYDDAVFVNYVRGKMRISVYIAHWNPGKMSHRLVAGHTPDVCWTQAGWQCESGRTVSDLEVRARRLQPAELRTMTQRGVTEYVIFWHLVGNQAVTYGTNWRPPWYAMFLDIWQSGLQLRKEQLFVRISSNQPLGDFWLAEPVQILASNLVDLGSLVSAGS